MAALVSVFWGSLLKYIFDPGLDVVNAPPGVRLKGYWGIGWVLGSV